MRSCQRGLRRPGREGEERLGVELRRGEEWGKEGGESVAPGMEAKAETGSLGFLGGETWKSLVLSSLAVLPLAVKQRKVTLDSCSNDLRK